MKGGSELDRREGERRHLKLNEVLTTVILILQLAVLVWGASALYHEVKALRAAVTEIRAEIFVNREATHGVRTDIEVLKSRIDTYNKR